jgi:hypothetical protein
MYWDRLPELTGVDEIGKDAISLELFGRAT